jgi:hypothetical protein
VVPFAGFCSVLLCSAVSPTEIAARVLGFGGGEELVLEGFENGIDAFPRCVVFIGLI